MANGTGRPIWSYECALGMHLPDLAFALPARRLEQFVADPEQQGLSILVG